MASTRATWAAWRARPEHGREDDARAVILSLVRVGGWFIAGACVEYVREDWYGLPLCGRGTTFPADR